MFKFWQKQPDPPKIIKIVRASTMTITMIDGSKQSWTVEPYTGTGNIAAWIDFYRWYFGRPTSSVYIQRYADGETMIRREDIRLFNVRTSSRKVDA